jgi:hypothetical protein
VGPVQVRTMMRLSRGLLVEQGGRGEVQHHRELRARLEGSSTDTGGEKTSLRRLRASSLLYDQAFLTLAFPSPTLPALRSTSDPSSIPQQCTASPSPPLPARTTPTSPQPSSLPTAVQSATPTDRTLLPDRVLAGSSELTRTRS